MSDRPGMDSGPTLARSVHISNKLVLVPPFIPIVLRNKGCNAYKALNIMLDKEQTLNKAYKKW